MPKPSTARRGVGTISSNPPGSQLRKGLSFSQSHQVTVGLEARKTLLVKEKE